MEKKDKNEKIEEFLDEIIEENKDTKAKEKEEKIEELLDEVMEDKEKNKKEKETEPKKEEKKSKKEKKPTKKEKKTSKKSKSAEPKKEEKTEPVKKVIKKKTKLKNQKALAITSVVLLSIIVVIGVLYYVLFPHVKLKGNKVMTINYKTVYKEKGYSAYKLKDNLTKDVKVEGKVNSDKIGEYKITYTVGKGIFKTKKTRIVKVSDIEKPKLSIKSDDTYVCPGKKYEKEEVTAKDNYDGDLTKKINVDIKKDKVTYSVKDSSGNLKVITKKIVYGDITKPVITLAGNAEENICVNEVYKDSGYTATDNCDGDLTSKVQVTGTVENTIEGEYNLEYKVKDKAGNEGKANRKVIVSQGDAPGTVYLTFDDGPNPGTTDVILDILKEEGVEATFFVTNNGPDDLIIREANEGHTVALHTASHDYGKIYSSDEAYFADLQAVHDRVQNLTGIDSRIIRFPGGSSNTVSRRYSNGIMSRLTQEVQNKGYKYYDWNISSGDAEGGSPPPSKIYNNVVSSLRKDRSNMVLMHDIKTYTRDALRDIIHYCKENGYQIKKISNCTEMVTQRVNN